MSSAVVARAASLTPGLVAEVGRLVPQLSSSAPAPTEEQLAEIIYSSTSVLFLARIPPEKAIVGMLTLVTYRIPTGLHAVIEDVVVDETRRGAGIGAALVAAALSEAEQRGARNVDLTSRPSREAANRLYSKMGFMQRNTNVYRHSGPR
ncbi:MAG: GNAT family N-acetyltransferase [Actinomycetota bacterium]|nr:GNAT family N-acetyltransferase [Actinomycetota bacterium]